jgi:WhiB family redox-sensing transcriptional regulator
MGIGGRGVKPESDQILDEDYQPKSEHRELDPYYVSVYENEHDFPSFVKRTIDEGISLRVFGYSEEDIAWRSQALCRSMGETIFFPERGYSMLSAYAICRGCPVRIECLDHAITEKEEFGVWAGFTPHERKNIRQSVDQGASLAEAMAPWDRDREAKLYKARAGSQAQKLAESRLGT